jgi:hypothetical protein
MQVVYNNLNKVGLKTVPCGTPESTDNLEDVIPFKRTCCCLFSKKSLIAYLENWEKTWQMKFNPEKCYVIHVTKKKIPFKFNYKLHNHILQPVDNSKHLGVTISNDLDWGPHGLALVRLQARLPHCKVSIILVTPPGDLSR